MQHVPPQNFGPFRLDPQQAGLWRGEERLPLRPRSLMVLRYLLERRGQVVTKEELRQQVWGGAYVSPAVIRVCIHEIRVALRDDAAAPRYVETVGRQGYRFLGQPVVTGGQAGAQPVQETGGSVVGRQQEVEALHQHLTRAVSGARQLVLLRGEAGIGKTTVLDYFLDQVATADAVRLARGQCVEHYGRSELYLPVLDALRRLALYDAATHRTLLADYGHDAKVLALTHLALVLWPLGYADQARQLSQEAYTWAQELGPPLSMASTLYYMVVLHPFIKGQKSGMEMC